MMNWIEIKKLLYALLTFFGIALMVASYPTMHSSDPVTQICGFVFLGTGTALLFFGLVTFFCRDDWEIWN